MTHLDDLEAGDEVIVDAGFTCMRQGLKTVFEDNHGLYVECDDGKHYLDGQEDEPEGLLVGVEKVRKPE